MLSKSRFTVIAAAAAIALAGAATAHGDDVPADINDPVSLRMNMMSLTGASMGVMASIAKGEAEFDHRVVQSALRTIYAVSLGYANQFPEGSDTGHDTEASPKIWEDKAGFDKAVAKFISDSAAAVALKPQDVDGMKQAMGMVGSNCKSCHEDWRVKKN